MDQEIKTLEAADIAKIMQALPHRYPFLMVDRIRDIDGDDFGVGIKNVTINEPHFQGHFPGHPVMPGVLLIEGMAQTAGALCVLAQGALGAAEARLLHDHRQRQVPQAGRSRATPSSITCARSAAAPTSGSSRPRRGSPA